MQDKRCNDGQELICINVDKVYDWIVKEKTFDFSAPSLPFPDIPESARFEDFVDAVFTCEVIPARMNPVRILDRENREFCIDGRTVCLQQLTIQKNFLLTVTAALRDGRVFRSSETTVSRCEQVTLCAPEGTDVEITFTDLDCFVCSTGRVDPTTGPAINILEFSDLNITIAACQSIQSTYPVTVEFLASFCEPREDLPTACPAPTHPKQCPSIFPDLDHRRH